MQDEFEIFQIMYERPVKKYVPFHLVKLKGIKDGLMESVI